MRVKFLHILLVLGLLLGTASAPLSSQPQDPERTTRDKVIFFAADGMRQDILSDYISKGQIKASKGLMQRASSAQDDGLLTQAPPNTGAGWYTLATGAWPGVTGSTNNTFHVNGQPFTNRTAA